jgi:(p)ppGpp synthase/HD superfamily hydrolase
MTYNDVKQIFGKEVADIVYYCTELRGRNRYERHGEEYINGLISSKLASYVKLCDICANMTMGKKTGSSMLEKYRKEYKTKTLKLYREEFKEIFEYIENNLLK